MNHKRQTELKVGVTTQQEAVQFYKDAKQRYHEAVQTAQEWYYYGSEGYKKAIQQARDEFDKAYKQYFHFRRYLKNNKQE